MGRNVALGRNLLEAVTCSQGLHLEERCPSVEPRKFQFQLNSFQFAVAPRHAVRQISDRADILG